MDLIKIAVSGTAVVALALFAALSLATGVGFNQVISGMGDVLVGIGVIAVIIVIILAIISVASRR